MHWFASCWPSPGERGALGGDLACFECDELDHLHRVGHRRERRGATCEEREQLDHGSVGHAHERGFAQVRKGALAEAASGRHRAGRRVSKAGFSAQPMATEEIDSEEERQTRWKKKETQGWMSWRRSSEHLLRRVLVQGGPPTRFFSKECSPLRAAWRREAATAALDVRPRSVECRALLASLLHEESEGQERSPRPESDGEGRTRAATGALLACAPEPPHHRQPDNSPAFRSSWTTLGLCRVRRARSCSRSWT